MLQILLTLRQNGEIVLMLDLKDRNCSPKQTNLSLLHFKFAFVAREQNDPFNPINLV